MTKDMFQEQINEKFQEKEAEMVEKERIKEEEIAKQMEEAEVVIPVTQEQIDSLSNQLKEINNRSEDMIFRVKEALNHKIESLGRNNKNGLEDLKQMVVR